MIEPCRYKHMSRQFWERCHSAKPVVNSTGGVQPSHVPDGPSAGNQRSSGLHEHDALLARRLFDKRDPDKVGFVEISQLLSLAEEIWGAEHPDKPLIGRKYLKVRSFVASSPIHIKTK